MNQYIIHCTEAQTKRALELGAPIIKRYNRFDDFTECILDNPTAEQMIGWLNIEKKIFVMVRPYVSMYHEDEYDSILMNLCNGYMLNVKQGCDNSKEATLAAIDAALEHLENLKQ